MVPLLMHDSVTLIIWKIMTYCYSHATNTSTLYFTVWKKNHILLLCNITVDLIRQSEYWVSVKFQQQIQVFQNSILCLKAQILSLETNTVSGFFEVTIWFHSSCKHICQVSNLNKHGLFFLLKQLYKCLSLKQQSYFSMEQNCFI